ncbi:MAG: CerR family C-terminal domain-containing protein [Rhizobiaceae bacterium]|nr:CerR family C-terminal domain-containing protein [Rhizobiaceae bacterium]
MSSLPTSADTLSGPEHTRAALVKTALRLFGRQGFEGTSTREIAAGAKANIGSIAYHFGGKEGLRLAVADHIVGIIQSIAAKAQLGMPADAPLDPEAAEKAMTSMIERMFSFFVTQPEAGELVPFVLREMSGPSPAFDRVYHGMMEPLHIRCCQLWEAATGEPADSDETRINVFMLIGQILYFRLAREAVRRRMGWTDIGRDEGAEITRIAIGNFKTLLAARKDRTR